MGFRIAKRIHESLGGGLYRRPSKMEEEEPECMYPKITEACKPQCTTPFAAYEVSGVDLRVGLVRVDSCRVADCCSLSLIRLCVFLCRRYFL